jgi:hypothetical protein
MSAQAGCSFDVPDPDCDEAATGAEVAAGAQAMPHAVRSASGLDAHCMKQLAQFGATAIIPTTTEVASEADATDWSCSAVHGGGGGPQSRTHAICSDVPDLLAHCVRQSAHSGAVVIRSTTTDVGFFAPATDWTCVSVQGVAPAK